MQQDSLIGFGNRQYFACFFTGESFDVAQRYDLPL